MKYGVHHDDCGCWRCEALGSPLHEWASDDERIWRLLHDPETRAWALEGRFGDEIRYRAEWMGILGGLVGRWSNETFEWERPEG